MTNAFFSLKDLYCPMLTPTGVGGARKSAMLDRTSCSRPNA
jgi:hypothetical protein